MEAVVVSAQDLRPPQRRWHCSPKKALANGRRIVVAAYLTSSWSLYMYSGLRRADCSQSSERDTPGLMTQTFERMMGAT